MAGGAYLVIALFFGLAGGVIGRVKGSSFVLWFLVSALLPFAGLLAAMLYRVERDELRRQCPTCGRVTKLYDALCTRCGSELEFPTQAIEPESAARARLA
jgi:ribosomal protein S27AE